jgi:predicted AAA+ superfamily ATPase
MYIERAIMKKMLSLAKKFPVIFLTGPRQSGKTTLLRHTLGGHVHISLEDEDVRARALDDPRGFLKSLGSAAVIDEAQRVPNLFSYIQTAVDAENRPGMYFLSGSQNFLMKKNISQSLAGRAAVLTLLPFSHAEIRGSEMDPATTDSWLVGGGYPRLVVNEIEPGDFFPSYVSTYIERDVRAEINIRSLRRFRSFLALLAARVGSPVNFTEIGKEAGVDARTASTWLGLLEDSYIIFMLPSYANKIPPRHVKTQKLYFFDTGLLCSLLNVDSTGDLPLHKSRGAIFENAVISEFVKKAANSGRPPRAFFWRDSRFKNKEVDLILESAHGLDLYEIKSSMTANKNYIDNLNLFAEKTDTEILSKTVIFDGSESCEVGGVPYRRWREL